MIIVGMKRPDLSNSKTGTKEKNTQPVLKADAPKESTQSVSKGLKPDKTIEVPPYSICQGKEGGDDKEGLYGVSQKKQ